MAAGLPVSQPDARRRSSSPTVLARVVSPVPPDAAPPSRAEKLTAQGHRPLGVPARAPPLAPPLPGEVVQRPPGGVLVGVEAVRGEPLGGEGAPAGGGAGVGCFGRGALALTRWRSASERLAIVSCSKVKSVDGQVDSLRLRLLARSARSAIATYLPCQGSTAPRTRFPSIPTHRTRRRPGRRGPGLAAPAAGAVPGGGGRLRRREARPGPGVHRRPRRPAGRRGGGRRPPRRRPHRRALPRPSGRRARDGRARGRPLRPARPAGTSAARREPDSDLPTWAPGTMTGPRVARRTASCPSHSSRTTPSAAGRRISGSPVASSGQPSSAAHRPTAKASA